MKYFFSLLLIVLVATCFSIYEIGDVVDDFTFLESDGGTPVERSIYQTIDEGKVLMFSFGGLGWSACEEEAPLLEELWQDYEAAGNFHLVTATHTEQTWEQLNGSGWRTHFTPSLTYWLSINEELNSIYWDYGNGYIPYNIIIGPDYKIYLSTSGYNDSYVRNTLDETIAAFGSDIDPPEVVDLYGSRAESNQDMVLNIILSDQSNIEAVIGKYDVGSGIIEMEFTAQATRNRFNYSFSGTIPAQPANTAGTIFFEITDANGNYYESPNYDLEWSNGVPPWSLIFSESFMGETDYGIAKGIEFCYDKFYITNYNGSYIHIIDRNFNVEGYHSVSGTVDVRDLAFDGEFLYGSRANNQIFQISPETLTLTNTITSLEGSYRAIAYDSTEDGFLGNNWDGDIVCTGRDGNTLYTIPNPGAMSAYGMAYDNYTQGGPYLWIFDQGGGYGFPQYIRQLHIESGEFTGIRYDVSLDNGPGVAGGLYITEDYETGKVIIGGLLQGTSPYGDYLVFGYNLVDIAGTSSEDETIPKSEYSLSNYPNPFNPSTEIRFQISDISDQCSDSNEQEAKIEIFNVKGQMIKEFSNLGSQNSIVWNGDDKNGNPVGSGIYFYKLKLDGKTAAVKKCMLLK